MKPFGAIERLIESLNRLPGIGRRSAQRIAFELLQRRGSLLEDLAAALREAAGGTAVCRICGGITMAAENPCRICSDPERDAALLCVVESPADIMLIENAGDFRGRYHVLGGKISPMRGTGADALRIGSLRRRLEEGRITEVILALNSDVESDATASMLKDLLGGSGVVVTRPAMGIPAGSGIGFLDRIPLNTAVRNRHAFEAAARIEKGRRHPPSP